MTNHTIRSLAAAMLAVSTLGALSPQAAGQVSAPVHAGPDAPLAAAHPVSHKMKAQLASSAAFDRSGVLWAVSRESETGSGHLVLQRSHDEGKSWGAKVQINSESVVASGDERPRINFGAHGEIYITYSHPLAQPYTSEVRFIHSEDGGRRFSLPVTVHQDRHIITHGFASTLVDAEGRIYITWIDKRDQQAAKDGGIAYVGAAQYYAVSSDGGRSFAGDFKIADHTCECCRSSIALNPEGHAVLMWRHVFRPNIRDHALVTLRPDGKLGEIERASFDNWAIDACPHQGPALAFGADGRRHQTWFTSGNDGGALFYAATRADGSLDAPLRLGNDQASNAEVAVSGQQVVVVWKEFDGEVTQIKSIHSQDGGATWETEILASTDGASDQPRLVKKDQQIFLIWRTAQHDILTVTLGRKT